MKFDDEYLKKIAAQYLQTDGELLKQELAADVVCQIDTASLDFRVKAGLRRKKKWYGIIMASAAGIALLFSSVTLLEQQPSTSELADQTAGIQSQRSGELPVTMISLTLHLPMRFSVARVSQDVGDTIYYLKDQNGDDVVMSVSHSDSVLRLPDLQERQIGGVSVKTLSEDEYYLAVFEKDGLFYKLTCRYELNTLIEVIETLIN